MANVLSRMIFTAVMLLILTVGMVILQMYLSKKQNKWYGLILPIISFLFSLIWPLSMVAPADGFTWSSIVQMMLIWLIANISTMILVVIYFACRENLRRQDRLNKMNIQDLG